MAKLVELDEGEYNRLMALQGIAQRMVANPQARRLLEQAQKTADPSAPTPFLDAEKNWIEPVNAAKKELSDEIAALKKEREDEKREATLARIAADQERAFTRLKTVSRYTDEGVAAVRKLMETKGILDVEDAVAIFERSNPPQVATPGGGITGDRWNFADQIDSTADKDIAALLQNRGDGQAGDAAVMRMAQSALAEIRGGR